MIDSILNLALCGHRNLTFPMTKRDENRTYVVCLACGKEFPYNWGAMRIEPKEVERSLWRSALEEVCRRMPQFPPESFSAHWRRARLSKSMRWKIIGSIFLGIALSAYGQIASGAGTVAAGSIKGAGKAAKDTTKGAGEIVTLHPVKGTESITKGAAGAGKDVTVGTVKGTGKIAKGVGHIFKSVF
jgi:hypothetical protein